MVTLRHYQQAQQHGLSLVGELNIYNAATLWQELLPALEARSQLEVDLESVEDFDTAGVQVLLAFKSEAERQDKFLRFVRHSTVVWEVLELLDLVAELGDSTPDMPLIAGDFQ